MSGTRKPESAPSASRVPEYVATRALSIHEASFLPGDRLTEASVEQLPPGRLNQLLRSGWVRRAE